MVKKLRVLFATLADIAVKMTKEDAAKKVKHRAEEAAEERILDILIPPAQSASGEREEAEDKGTRQIFRKKLREGLLDDKEIELDVAPQQIGVEIIGASRNGGND